MRSTNLQYTKFERPCFVLRWMDQVCLTYEVEGCFTEISKPPFFSFFFSSPLSLASLLHINHAWAPCGRRAPPLEGLISGSSPVIQQDTEGERRRREDIEDVKKEEDDRVALLVST